MFAKAVLPVSVSSLFTKLSSEPWPGIPSLPAWGERPVGWAWHRGAAGFFGSVAPPLALMEKTEESFLLCICLGLAAMGSESGNEPVRGWQRFRPCSGSFGTRGRQTLTWQGTILGVLLPPGATAAPAPGQGQSLGRRVEMS